MTSVCSDRASQDVSSSMEETIMCDDRIVGMSRRQNPPRLLAKIGDRPSFKHKTPKALDDPPLSTDDEADDDAPGANQPGCRGDVILGSSDSSDDEKTLRASIRQTSFGGKPTQTGASQRETRRKSAGDARSGELETRGFGGSQASGSKRQRLNGASTATYGRRAGPSSTPPSSGGHLTDERGFTKRKPSKFTYKKKNTSSQEQPDKRPAASGPGLRIPDPIDSPMKPQEGMLRIADGPALSSPPGSPRAQLVLTRHKNDDVLDSILASPKQKPVLKTPVSLGALGDLTNRRPRLGQKKKLPAPPRSPSPPGAVFKVPAQFSDLENRPRGDGDGDAALSDIASDAEDGGRLPDVQTIDDDAPTAAMVCPWCGKPVDKPLLDDFSKGERMNVRQQTRFCRTHHKQTALETWRARRYPEVEWQGLDERFAAHRGLLLDIVNGKPSHFRGVLAAKVASGQARSMKKEDNLNPGYYGPRGFNLMCDYLVGEFGDLLKARAVDDRVIAGRGSAAFIQAVLVAELAVQLIKDDMGVSVDEARAIMEESKALGEMVHEEA